MSSSSQFPSGLNHWTGADKPTRADFVRDNSILDENALWKQDYDPSGAVAERGGIAAYALDKDVYDPDGSVAAAGGIGAVVKAAQNAMNACADSATKLATPRTIRTNLAATAAAGFDGSADVTPGVTGVLPVANGGTGVSNAPAEMNRLFETPLSYDYSWDANVAIVNSTRTQGYYLRIGTLFAGIKTVMAPATDNNVQLGTQYARWKEIWLGNSPIVTSDKTQKMDIGDIADDSVIAFVEGLPACRYKMLDGTSGRTHYGFIAQDLEDLMARIGLDSLDFAGFIKSPKVETVMEIDEDGEEHIKEYKTIEGEYTYGLRYEEFIPVLWRYAQLQKERMDGLETRVAALENARNRGDC